MDFGFSEEQEMLRSSARDFLAKEAPMTWVRRMMEDAGFRDLRFVPARDRLGPFATAVGRKPVP